MPKFLIYFLFTALFVTGLYSQPDPNLNLALQYYKNSEFDKAVELFADLYKKNKSSDYYYRYYYNCLLKLEEYKDLEKLVKKQMKNNPANQIYTIDLGYAYSQQGELEKAYSFYDGAINQLKANRNEIIRAANTFNNIREHDFAVKAYEKGRKLLHDYPFYYELANLYLVTGKNELMIENYINYIQYSPNQIKSVQNILSKYVDDKEIYLEIQRQLYRRIQNHPNEIYFHEMLIWLFVQKKDFGAAFLQAKALDKRNREDGLRIFNLAMSAINEKDYAAAIKSLQYLVDKGADPSNKYYFYARETILNVQKKKITGSYDYTTEELHTLKDDYTRFLGEFGYNRLKSSKTLRDLALLNAFYLHEMDSAIVIMEELVKTPGLSDGFISKCKLDLGDYYLMNNEVWEATLLYSQVDLKMKDEPLGEMARFKNAKLSYFMGDFEWAQGQLNVLKGSTSELISNDALDLSVFITSNLGLDTTINAMMIFSRADLLSFQNRDDEAILALDSIVSIYPGHQLLDDVQFKKAKIMLKRNNPEQAARFLHMVLEQSADVLLMDDATFLLANLYEEVFEDHEKAMELYEKIILDYKDSVFVIKARERFRNLRGDKLN